LDGLPGAYQLGVLVQNDQRICATQLRHGKRAADPGGGEEGWCADFVSWVMREAGAPLKNGNTGGWRIPGTFTLQEYYESIGKFQKAGNGYQPKPGDVAMYNGSPIFGDHTNIVVQNNDGALVTVGGNEDGRIRVYNNTKKDYDGLLGYGVVD